MARALVALLMICVLIASGVSPPLSPTTAQSRPNFVVVVVDDLDAASVVHMPAVKRLLGDQGATFSQFFATTPLCCPSRASILRGQYAHNHGVLRNTGDDAGFAAFQTSGSESATMATLLDDAGYETALVGKYLNGYSMGGDNRTYIPPGWDFWAAGIDHAAYDGFRYELNVNGELVRYGNDDRDYMTDVLASHAQEFLAAATSGSEPFLLYLAPYAPHSPSTPAPRHKGHFAGAKAPRTPAFNERNIKDKPDWVRESSRMSDSRIMKIDADYRRRLESLLAVDEMIDVVVGQLEQAGVLESTYVLFLSDNGYFLGEHRQPHGKDAPYDAASRVPAILRGPDVPAGSTVDALALNIDLLPTVLDLAGLNAPSFIDGRSLASIARGDDRGWRRSALLEGFGKETESLEGTESSTPPFRALREEDVLYVEYETGERELYNLRKDPFQLSNLVREAGKPLLRAYSRQLQALSSCAGQDCQALENATSPRVASTASDRRQGADKPRARHERQRSNRSGGPETLRSTSSDQVLEIRDGGDDVGPLQFELSGREARMEQLQLRVHVASVETPGTLVAIVEWPGSGRRERLSSVPVQSSGWMTLEISAALGDTREIAIGLRGRDGAALSVSGPDSSRAPELVSEQPRRPDEQVQASDTRGRRSPADRADNDRPGRERNGDRRRGR
jgi:N-acetylglucosamine-6-sulfatase